MSPVIPRGYLYAGAFVLASAAITAHTLDATHEKTRAIEAAKRFVRDSIAIVTSNVLPAQRETVTVRVARVDTLFRRISQKAETVTVLADRVPDTVRVAFPIVDTLATEARKLAVLVPVLRDSVSSERSARDSVRATLSIIASSVRDSLHVELQRPKRTLKGTLAATASGLVFGAVLSQMVHR